MTILKFGEICACNPGKVGDNRRVRIAKYRRYRDYERQRADTNDSMMGLLAGSKIAYQTLGLTAGSSIELGKIFPLVPHISRFNLRVDEAKTVLDRAEDLLGVLSVPRILALHEDLVLGMLRLVGKSKSSLKDVGMNNMHETLEAATKRSFNPESLGLFHLVRLARNAHIHNDGRASRELAERAQRLAQSEQDAWTSVAGERFPCYSQGDEVHLRVPELIGILAVTKRLGEEANVILQASVAAAKWADLVVEDWAVDKRPGNPGQQFRQVTGLARREYAPIGLSSADLQCAMTRAGFETK